MSYLNDLWNFDGSNWTWVSGSDTGDQAGGYGTKGTPSPSNIPGARGGSISWTDSGGNLWLFGGYGWESDGDSGWLNDLWKFNGTHWTWISGSDTVDQIGVYGTKGEAHPDNIPRARSHSISWIDSSGNLWLFGGYKGGYASIYQNDLWKFDGSNWTWVSGSDTGDQAGVYGTKRVVHPDNIPGARGGSISWTDSADNLWLFGGLSITGPEDEFESLFNDLWKFDGTNWTWVNGSAVPDQAGVYGTKGTPDPANIPGARWGSISWIDSSDNLWLFGAYGEYNDLWKLKIPGEDDCVNAIEVELGQTYAGTSEGATGTDITGICGLSDDYDVWYQFSSPLSGDYTFSLCGSAFDTTLAIFNGCSGTELACNDDNTEACGAGTQSQLTMELDSGTTYWIRIAGHGRSTGEYMLTVSGCGGSIIGDLSGDCRVGLEDFAILALHWLDCNLKPSSICAQ